MISVTILTKNNEKYLSQVLRALADFDEVLIYDTGSTDQTIPIVQAFSNVRLLRRHFEGFGPTHNKASTEAKHSWILSIDSDEVMTPELVYEIKNLSLDPECVYSIPRKNIYNDKWIKGCGWHPDRQIRLYNKSRTQFTDAQVHEAIIVDNRRHVALKSPLIHYSYTSTTDFLSKMQIYSDLFAKQNRGKRSSSIATAIFHGLFAFFKSYFLKRGFLGGEEELIISVYNGNTAFYKYLKLWEENKRERGQKK